MWNIHENTHAAIKCNCMICNRFIRLHVKGNLRKCLMTKESYSETRMISTVFRNALFRELAKTITLSMTRKSTRWCMFGRELAVISFVLNRDVKVPLTVAQYTVIKLTASRSFSFQITTSTITLRVLFCYPFSNNELHLNMIFAFSANPIQSK